LALFVIIIIYKFANDFISKPLYNPCHEKNFKGISLDPVELSLNDEEKKRKLLEDG